MKVLHLLDTVNRGGAEMQALDVCRNAGRFGLELTFVAAGGGVLEGDFQDSGVEYIRLQRRLPVDIYFASQLRKIIKEKSIEIVQGYQAVEGLHLYLATRGLNVKNVLSFQGFVPGRKNRITARLLSKRMDANIAVSKSLLTYLKTDLGIKDLTNFSAIYNSADEARLKPTGKRLKQELNLPEHAVMGGMVANFVPDPTKDQFTICRALPSVCAYRDFHFVFAGRVSAGAEYRMAECRNYCIENGIRDRVHFLGERSDVADILADLDIFVFSSRREGMGVAIAEAMLAGVPVIVSDIEPLLEVSADGKYAGIFQTGNAEALSEKMLEFLRDKTLRDRFAEDARAYAREHFSIEAHLFALRRLYESLV